MRRIYHGVYRPSTPTGGAVMKITQGDAIEIVSNKVDQPHRRGVVQRVLDQKPLRIEVTWDDGRTTILMPTGGNLRVLHGSR